MKAFLLLLIVPLFFFEIFRHKGENNDTQLTRKLQRMDVRKYESGKTPLQLFEDEGLKYKQVIFYKQPPSILVSVRFVITDSLSLLVYFNNAVSAGYFDSERSWKINGILKEPIRKVSIECGDRCIKGCDVELLTGNDDKNYDDKLTLHPAN